MGFWWFMFLCDLLIPFIMIIAGGYGGESGGQC